MRNSFILLSAFLYAFLACGCSSYVFEQPATPDSEVDCVRFTVADYLWDDITKTQAQKQDGGVVFTWSEKDTVGICPDSGAQVYFDVQKGAGSAEAVFNGGGWALKRNHRYAAYYPYNRYNFQSCNIPLVYGTQHQRGSDNLDDIAKYDYMASKMTVPSNGEVNFQFQHLASLVRFKLTIPEGAQFTEFILAAGQSVFPVRQSLDLTYDEPVLYTDETSDSLKIELSEISLSERGEIILYALVPVVNLNNKPLTILLNTPLPSQVFTAQITGRDFQAGKAYGYTTELCRIFIPQCVDLGLTSGLKWATCNVGALHPEDYGGIFRWGETEARTTDFTWTTYKYCMGEYNKLTKYCYRESYGYMSYTDDKITLDPEDDAATVNWGEDWRMPTYSEMEELMEQCTWTPDQVNGIYGFKVKGPNGNSIFLPAAGYGFGNNINGRGWNGRYWSSTLDTQATTIGSWTNPDVACGLEINTEAQSKDKNLSSRSNGHSVRPVHK